MSLRTFFAIILIVAVLSGAMFGLTFMMSGHESHGMACPFTQSVAALCALPLAHLKDWQATFTAIFAQILILFALVALYISRLHLPTDAPLLRRLCGALRIPYRPTRLQELYADGILNRKETYCS